MSRELLSRAWSAGAGPGPGPLTIDLDSTICETYGLAKEEARHHGYTGARGYHPLLAVAAGTGDVLMARLREGRANTARGAGHFLREEESVRRWPIGFCRMLSVWGRLAIPDTITSAGTCPPHASDGGGAGHLAWSGTAIPRTRGSDA